MPVIDLRTTPPRTSGRYVWMDVVRGVAVLLIIVFHASPVLRAYEIRPPGWVPDFNEFFAPFRIPTLVFLSGVLLGPSLRKPVATYLDGKLRHIAWPYAIWVSLFAVLRWPAPLEHPSFFLGGTYLWFLVFIGFYYVVALAVRRVPTALVVAVALVIALVAPDGSKYGERLAFLFAVFMTGHLLAQRGLLASYWLRSLPLAAVGLTVVVVGFVLDVGPFSPSTLPVTLGGMALLIVVAQRGQRVLSRLGVAYLGRNSIVFYVSHFPVMVLLGSLLADVPLPMTVVWAAVIVGALAVSTCLSWLSKRTVASWLFSAPFRLWPQFHSRSAPGEVDPAAPVPRRSTALSAQSSAARGGVDDAVPVGAVGPPG